MIGTHSVLFLWTCRERRGTYQNTTVIVFGVGLSCPSLATPGYGGLAPFFFRVLIPMCRMASLACSYCGHSEKPVSMSRSMSDFFQSSFERRDIFRGRGNRRSPCVDSRSQRWRVPREHWNVLMMSFAVSSDSMANLSILAFCGAVRWQVSNVQPASESPARSILCNVFFLFLRFLFQNIVGSDFSGRVIVVLGHVDGFLPGDRTCNVQSFGCDNMSYCGMP